MTRFDTITDKIIRYLAANPDSGTLDIATAVGTMPQMAGRVLNMLAESGTVKMTGHGGYKYDGHPTKTWTLAKSIDEKLAETVAETVPEYVSDPNLTSVENAVIRYVTRHPGSTVTEIADGTSTGVARGTIYRALCRLDEAGLLITATLNERGTRAYYPPEAME